MGALSFMGQFVPMVKAGLRKRPGGKRQSIRNFRRRPLKEGERLVLYFAQRSKWCKRLGETTVSKRFVVRIDKKSVKVYYYRWEWQKLVRWDLMTKESIKNALRLMKLVHHYTSSDDLDAFAKSDGFPDWNTMKRWWTLTHGSDALPYTGNLYTW